jgi:hypothetical protein
MDYQRVYLYDNERCDMIFLLTSSCSFPSRVDLYRPTHTHPPLGLSWTLDSFGL